MILVRDIFQLKFGKARPAQVVLKAGLPLLKKGGYVPQRFLTDFSGDFYTLIMESSFKDLAEYQRALKANLGDKRWKEWYKKFVSAVKSGLGPKPTCVELKKNLLGKGLLLTGF